MGRGNAKMATDVPCRRNLKDELARLEADKKWLLKNRSRIFNTLDMYEKFYESLGRTENHIIICKEDIAEEKVQKKAHNNARKEQKAAQKELAKLKKQKAK